MDQCIPQDFFDLGLIMPLANAKPSSGSLLGSCGSPQSHLWCTDYDSFVHTWPMDPIDPIEEDTESASSRDTEFIPSETSKDQKFIAPKEDEEDAMSATSADHGKSFDFNDLTPSVILQQWDVTPFGKDGYTEFRFNRPRGLEKNKLLAI